MTPLSSAAVPGTTTQTSSAPRSATGPAGDRDDNLGFPGRPDAYPLNLYLFTSWGPGAKPLVGIFCRGPMADNAKRTGAALEAHYQFLFWLLPTVEKFPRSHKFTLGDRIETIALERARSADRGHLHAGPRRHACAEETWGLRNCGS